VTLSVGSHRSRAARAALRVRARRPFFSAAPGLALAVCGARGGRRDSRAPAPALPRGSTRRRRAPPLAVPLGIAAAHDAPFAHETGAGALRTRAADGALLLLRAAAACRFGCRTTARG
jgi:hypothetical protein